MQALPPPEIAHIPLTQTGFFSKLVIDYLANEPQLQSLYNFSPDLEGIRKALDQRKQFPVNREALVSVIQKQYQSLPSSDTTNAQIALLADDNTYTVCTAHQPNLATGYAYFIYKIMHTVVLCKHLKQHFPQYNFVPIFYIGSEDDDLDELGFFRFNEHAFRWNNQQAGAVGRMNTESLKPLLQDFFKVLGPPSAYTDMLQELLSTSYLQHNTIAEATQFLVHSLFGALGLIALNPDDALLKQQFLPIIQQEVLAPKAYGLLQQDTALTDAGYKTQAFARPINFFYLKNDLRLRIEQKENRYVIVGSDISFSEAEIQAEMLQHPERFSPNVILRGLYQETILPNVAFIGGGAEVAYWLQLKSVFDAYKVFYPAIILRQSIQFINSADTQLMRQLGYATAEVFLPTERLVKQRVHAVSTNDWMLAAESQQIETALMQIKDKAKAIDKNLETSIGAALKKMQYQLGIIEKKLYKAEKRNLKIEIDRIYRLKNHLFPNGTLQERNYTFMQEYVHLGPAYFSILEKAILPFGNQFSVVHYTTK